MIERGEPYERVGLCHGELCKAIRDKMTQEEYARTDHDTALYLVSRSRYRCSACFKIETGHNP